ncbi:MAG: helix-turn-helix domain-containing protein [candidate division KSB1 bacterium]|nr:helix-turn-helix domain-containing protein [candidate division KSB1 bacterium]MDZ7369435.1 helix-turn-helix domain-containing protein [candidate division KSB1 bacterium]MDZ7407530.1 helix-turn-helix domain-containing protein [candidate division KSB1 bacterium]
MVFAQNVKEYLAWCNSPAALAPILLCGHTCYIRWGTYGRKPRPLCLEIRIQHSKKHHVSEDTLRKWLAAYQAKGFDGLKPRGRSDQGHARKIPAEVFEKAVALKKEAPQRGVAKIIRIMETTGLIKQGAF